MAKFCVYCGKPLKEGGEVCSCRSQAAPAAPRYQSEPYAAPQPAPVQPAPGNAAAVSAAGSYSNS